MTTERVLTRAEELSLRANHRITPSNIDPWFGRWEDDDRLTVQQLVALAERGIDPATVEIFAVRMKVRARDMWWPVDTAAPTRIVECPVLCRRTDGRVEVIAPIGDRKIVHANGSIRREREPRANYSRRAA